MSEFANAMTNSSGLPLTTGRLAKSMFDHVAALLILILISPLLMIIALLISLDGGICIFGHRRVGRNGREFKCLKFRTMLLDSDKVLAKTLAEDPDAAAEWAANQKLRNDPRLTRIGRFCG